MFGGCQRRAAGRKTPSLTMPGQVKMETTPALRLSSSSSSATRDNQIVCQDGSRCTDYETCCQIGDVFGCCPYYQATCCDDMKNCCPSGFRCDLAAGLCIPQGLLETEVYYEMKLKRPSNEDNRELVKITPIHPRK